MRKALYVLGILSDEDVEWMAAHGRCLMVKTDEILIREGEPVDAIFILLDGSLSVTAGRKKVATLLSGEIVGEISFVDSHPPSATVTAAQSSRVLALPRELLRARLRTDPWFASRFFQALATFLADRLRSTTARLGYGDAPGDTDRDEIDLDQMDSMSLAAARFDMLLKRLQRASG